MSELRIVDSIPDVPIDLEYFQYRISLTNEDIAALQKGKFLQIEVGMGGEYQVYLSLERREEIKKDAE